MEGTYSKAFESLGAYPIVQAAVAVLILAGGLYLIFRTSHDKLPPSQPSTPIQIESPWLVQHLVEMHLVIDRIDERLEKIARKIGAG
jgi:hypothetical protein